MFVIIIIVVIIIIIIIIIIITIIIITVDTIFEYLSPSFTSSSTLKLLFESLQYYFIFLLQVINIFNLFITYGDTFLPSPTSYDELYYEIIRVHQIFDNLYSMGKTLAFMMTSYTVKAITVTMMLCKHFTLF